MANAVEKLKVIIEASIAPLKKEMEAAKSVVKSTTDAINAETGKVKNPFENMDSTGAMAKIREMKASIQKELDAAKVNMGTAEYTDEFNNLKGQIADTEAELSRLYKEEEKLRNAGAPTGGTDAWRELENALNAAYTKLGNMKDREERMLAINPAAKKSAAYKGLEYDLKLVNHQLDQLEASERNMRASGENTGASNAWKQNQQDIAEAESRLGGYKSKLESVQASGKATSKIGNFFKGISGGAEKASNSAKKVSQIVSGVLNSAGGAAKSLIQKFRSLGSEIGKIGSGIKGLASKFNLFGNSGGALNIGFMNLLRYGLGIRSLFALFNRMRSGVVAGFQNLAQASAPVNASISMLMSSLTQLRNALATAFAPVLEVVAPILNTLIQLLVKAATAVGAFFSALTGKSVMMKAVKVNQNYASSLAGASSNLDDANSGLDDNASAADKATKANKKLQATILGFDEIQKMDDNSDSDAGSGSGSSPKGRTPGAGSGGAGGINPADMFEEVPIDSGISKFADMFKEAWANADFTDIGRIVGEKLRDALNNIPWDEIRTVLDKIAKSIATFLNGFLETPGLFYAIGNTIAQALNTAFEFVDTFAVNFHWDSLGIAVATGINAALMNLNWELIQKTVQDVVGGIVISIVAFITTTDWSLVGASFAQMMNTAILGIYTAITTFNWGATGDALHNALSGAIENVDPDEKFGTAIGTLITDIGTLLSRGFGDTQNWVRLGHKIADEINAMFESINPTELADGVNAITSAITETFKTAIGGLNSDEISQKIRDFLNNLNWDNIFSIIGIVALPSLFSLIVTRILPQIGMHLSTTVLPALATAIGGIVGQLPAFLLPGIGIALAILFLGTHPHITQGLSNLLGFIVGEVVKIPVEIFKAIVEGLTNMVAFFQQEINDCGGNIVLGILKGILDGLLGIGQWIIDNIFKPFVDGFKSAFGIHSPSTVMQEQGGYIMDGLKNGVTDKLDGFIQFFKDLPGKVKEGIGNAKEWIKEKGSDMVEGLRNGWDDVKDSRFFNTIRNVGNDVKTGIGDAAGWIREKGTAMIEGLTNGWDSDQGNLESRASNTSNLVTNAIGDAAEWIKGKGSDMITGLRNGWDDDEGSFTDLAAQLPGKITDSIGDLWSLGHNIISDFAQGFQSIDIKLPHIDWSWNDFSLPGGFSFSLPSFNGISWYAGGGYFTGPTLVSGLGEAGDEAVLPLTNRRAMKNIANSIVEAGGGGTDPEVIRAAVADGVSQALQDDNRETVVYATLKTEDDETLARAVARGNRKMEYRYDPVGT